MSMIMVEIRFRGDRVGRCVTTQDDLFNMAWALEESPFVIEFRVEGTVPKNFGWGVFQKWVVKFRWHSSGEGYGNLEDIR